MMTIRQRARPKHQALILKCFPRFFKSAAEIKPNPSELSYLLYYASTRRSKLQKVGDFLEHKAAHDVRSGRINNVQVILQILTALIEKCSRDLPLYCQSVLGILNTILTYRDVQLVEDSVVTFDAFCRHYDSAQLSADAGHVSYVEDIVRSYAAFASKQFTSKTKSVPLALRYRSAALKAIRSLVASDAFLTDVGGRKMRLIMPEILDSLYAPDRPSYMSLLQDREAAKERVDKEQTSRRRQSISVGRSEDTEEADPQSAFGTTADADERAKEEVDLIALQSLRQICYSGRTQLRNCAREILQYVLTKAPIDPMDEADALAAGSTVWATEVLENACHWTPVQDRFILLIVLMETLIRSPVRESDLPRQLHLVGIIKWLLRSNINFIGLSVIDVLLGLIQRIFMLLQLHGRGTLAPLQKQGSHASPPRDGRTGTPTLSSSNLGASTTVVDEIVQTPTETRKRLLGLFETCIGDLATHIYYSDQVGDMISALLHRLKPLQTTSIPHLAAAVENPGVAADAIADSVEIKERPQTDGFFSFDTARVCLLRAAKEVIIVANSPRKDGTIPPSRNSIGVSAWKNTQWLLCDPDVRVRMAYVDALLAWARHEVGKSDLKVTSDVKPGSSKTVTESQSNIAGLAKRAASSASHKAKIQANAQGSFVHMLHLAVYENALQYSESEGDIQLLHLLLSTLSKKLGVNAVRSSLPMMFTLQEDIFVTLSWTSKIAIGSLVHGYLSSLAETFNFESSAEGKEILNEIGRRQREGLWLAGITTPPVSLEKIEITAGGIAIDQPAVQPAADANLCRYENRQALVECISEAYGESLPSPMPSPPTSPRNGPRRTFSTASAMGISRQISVLPQISPDRRLPVRIREEMLSPWSKEAIMAAAEQENAKSSSLRTASASSKRNNNNLTTNGASLSNNSDANLAAAVADPQMLTSRPQSATYPRASGYHQPGPHMRHLQPGGIATPLSDSSGHSVLRVSDLKRVLSGTYSPAAAARDMDGGSTVDEPEDRSNSIIATSFNNSDISLPREDPQPSEMTPRRGTAVTSDETPRADNNEHTPVARRPSEVGLGNYAQSNVSTQALSMHTAYTVIPPSENGSTAVTPSANQTVDPFTSNTGSYAHFTTPANPDLIYSATPSGAQPINLPHADSNAPPRNPTTIPTSSLDIGSWAAYSGSSTSPAPQEEDDDIPPVPELPASLKPLLPAISASQLAQKPRPADTTIRPRTAERQRPATMTTMASQRFPVFNTLGGLGMQDVHAEPRKRVDVSKLLSGLDEAAEAAANRRAGMAAVGLGAPPF